MIELLSDDGRFRAVVVEVTTGVEVVLWRSIGTFGRADDRRRTWRRIERSVFDQPIDVVCDHVEALLKTLAQMR
jgi:hypothetical protein